MKRRLLAGLGMVCAMAAAAEGKTIKVAMDGSGDFKRVQEAVDAAPLPAESAEGTVIEIAPGTYEGFVHVPKEKGHLTIRGEDAKTTILAFATAPGLDPPGAATQPALKMPSGATIVDASDFTAEHVTFLNTAVKKGPAVALLNNGERNVYRDCRFLSTQDTLFTARGRSYFKDCTIEGTVDFIFGGGAAVFENCEVHSVGDGYVTAASTDERHTYGLVFLNCRLTGAEGVKASLGRPWRPYAAVTYIGCEMGPHVRPEGWDNWGKGSNEKTARYAEYGCTGPGAGRSKRVGWAKELTKEEAEKVTVEAVVGGKDGWVPEQSRK